MFLSRSSGVRLSIYLPIFSLYLVYSVYPAVRFRTVFLPIQLTPTVEEPVITVNTIWPGASPYEIEREIIEEQEEQLKSVEGLQKMESSSSDSQGSACCSVESV